MKEKAKELILYAIWLCLYILCVGLGTAGQMEGIGIAEAIGVLKSTIDSMLENHEI